jgi:hypothetical protein
MMQIRNILGLSFLFVAGCVQTATLTPLSAQGQQTQLQNLPGWLEEDDAGTSGTASGTTMLVSTPSLSGSARQFVTTFTNGGGERYYVSFGSNTVVQSFLYDAEVYIAGDSSTIANIEMDMNQVTANGQTVIYGVQCDGYAGTWDYTENTGTPTDYVDTWVNSSVPCNPRSWSINTWHHVQIAYYRDNSGNVTYEWVSFDGAQSWINATVPSSFALGWASVLLTNFQVDGLGASGTNTVYVDNLSVTEFVLPPFGVVFTPGISLSPQSSVE